MKARRETLVGGWLRVFLLVGLVSGFPASAAGALAVQTIPRESVRWHYERALVLDAQGHTGRAIAALYRALDAAKNSATRLKSPSRQN
ncbi:hypothetical protein J8C07_07795 [Chloracidobacterium sp. S]|uniref:hypothetical protein n=1 Tax=Chloracidobacterium aggregatum TaxID=2851959 RepID=UPI001B8B131C|nr:hypothetical protein [Chloracidobacterium aggregatum]QUV87096.1 hypothetical protein J8C07_07795 [Chloracidobacterium sp. S]